MIIFDHVLLVRIPDHIILLDRIFNQTIQPYRLCGSFHGLDTF